jgi:hypothetical protein
MSDNHQWGPWIEHDGRGCHCKGQYVTTELFDKSVREHIAHGYCPNKSSFVDCWNWEECQRRQRPEWRVIRYRIRKPRGLTILEGLLENLPSKVDA